MLPLLRTKTIIPPLRPRQIERPRLLARLDEAAHHALTLIIAPAGFGKTTLTAAWAHASPLPVAWLSLQPADRNSERFLAYLIQALQTIDPHLGQTTLALLQGSSPEGALYALANDLAALPSDIVLVLDDYHSAESGENAAMLHFLLENRPPTLHIALVSRTQPELNLARLRALGQVCELTIADLRFNEAEVRAFIETSMELHLPPEALARLNQSTEGWAVGLQLAALALARQPANWQALAGQEHIFDYLADEVLCHQPAEVQHFLKITAIFDRFCLPLCEALFTDSGFSPPAALAAIERANLFLIPLDAHATWYRYHALFTDFLRRQIPNEQAARYHRQASQWFEQNDLLDDAIHSATHAADHERAASLLETHYRDMLQRGEQNLLNEAIESLPPEYLQKHPRLWLARGWASVIGLNSVQAVTYAVTAEALLPADPAADPLRGEAKALRILADIFGGRTATESEIASTLELLAEQDDFLHSLLHLNLGLHHVMDGETAHAIEAFGETLRLTEASGNPLVRIVAAVQMAETHQLRGALGLAERTFQQIIRYVKETLGEHTFLLGMPYVSYAELLREQNRFDEAIRYAEQGIAYCKIWQPVASMDGKISLARLRAAQGQWQSAYAYLDDAMQLAENSVSVLDDSFIAIQVVRLALLEGNLHRAHQTIQAYEIENLLETAYYHVREMAQLTLCRAHLAEDGRNTSTLKMLTDLIGAAQLRERVTTVIEASLLQAYALHAANRPVETTDSLSHALSLGAQGGYMRIFADEGRPLLHLLEQYRPRLRAPHTFLDPIITLLRREATAPTSQPANHQPSTLVPLTRRELDILQLLAAGKSNQEIAAERVLTVNTVKKHVANILSKLGVANRTQAVMLARKAGWLEQ